MPQSTAAQPVERQIDAKGHLNSSFMSPAPERRIRVLFVQPNVPAYRLPLFDSLAHRKDMEIRVRSSPAIPGGPPSAVLTPSWLDSTHPLFQFFGGAFLWQRGLSLPKQFGQGDVLVVAGNPRFLSNFPLMMHAKLKRVAIVWWGHGWSPTSTGWSAKLRYRLMELADVVLLYADKEIPQVRSHLSPNHVILATNNSLDPKPMLAARDNWESKIGQFIGMERLTGKRVVLFCGRLRPGSQVDILIRALSNASEKDEIVVAIIGAGELEGSLRQLAKSLQVERYIRWLGAQYDEELLAPWFLVSKCFVYPGSIGLSLLHAFSYGLPVVTHDQPSLHNPEIHALHSGLNGLTFSKDDPDSLWQAMKQVLGSHAFRDRLAAQAHRTAHEEWSFERTVERVANAVLIASHKSGLSR